MSNIKLPDKLHWDKGGILSRNCLFNFIVGARGVGKTWAFKYKAFKDFTTKGYRFVYMMRYATELDQATQGSRFFADLAEYFPGYQFKREGFTGFIRYVDEKQNEKDVPWELCCYFKALSEHAIKAMSDPEIKMIIFDEFIPNPGVNYLKGEVDKLLEYYFTISRGVRNVRMVFLGNNVRTVTPYFVYFNRYLPEQGQIIAKDDIAIENVKNQAFEDTMKATRFGKLVAGTKYADYAIENKTFVDEDTFVERLPKGANCVVKLVSQYGDLYIWTWRGECIFISDKGDPSVITWACDQQSHKEGSEFIGFAGSLATTLLKRHQRVGTIRYTSPRVKSSFLQACAYIFT